MLPDQPDYETNYKYNYSVGSGDRASLIEKLAKILKERYHLYMNWINDDTYWFKEADKILKKLEHKCPPHEYKKLSYKPYEEEYNADDFSCIHCGLNWMKDFKFKSQAGEPTVIGNRPSVAKEPDIAFLGENDYKELTMLEKIFIITLTILFITLVAVFMFMLI